jgi:hypothetical protein
MAFGFCAGTSDAMQWDIIDVAILVGGDGVR